VGEASTCGGGLWLCSLWFVSLGAARAFLLLLGPWWERGQDPAVGCAAATSHRPVGREETQHALRFLPPNEMLCCFVFVGGPPTVIVDKVIPADLSGFYDPETLNSAEPLSEPLPLHSD